MEKLSYKLEVFEGPLDLLIALIGKHKIDIADINISNILEQYMAYLAMMQEIDLEIASEFLVMASNLIYIKSKMLLPKSQTEEEDPRLTLVQAIWEYQRHKESSQILGRLFRSNEGIFVNAMQELPDTVEAYEKIHSPEELQSAFLRVYEKNNRRLPPPITSFNGIVGREAVPVSLKLTDLLRRLVFHKFLTFFDIFKNTLNRSEIVATFLAILELTKTKRVIVDNEENCEDGTRFVLKIGNSGDK
jgi:segregation and condensation protein A